MSRIIEIRPLDAIVARYGEKLAALGSPARVNRVIARAANYEGRKALTRVRRALVRQTSIPRRIVVRSTRFLPASTSGGAVQVAIHGTGRGLSLKEFGARQNRRGVRARVWGKSKQFAGGFMGPKPGAISLKLGGHAFRREGKKRTPIEKLLGPALAKELVKDESAQEFYAAQPMIIDRVAKEIAAVLRGY
mgnify:CR=1 FL=1